MEDPLAIRAGGWRADVGGSIYRVLGVHQVHLDCVAELDCICSAWEGQHEDTLQKIQKGGAGSALLLMHDAGTLHGRHCQCKHAAW